MDSTQTKRPRLTKKRRALLILNCLKELYPEAPCSLDYETPLQLLIATMLSAQCTDARVNMVTPALFDRFPTVTVYAVADVVEIESYV